MNRDTVFSLCNDMDVCQVEINMALAALGIIQESLDNAQWPGCDRYSDALCSICNTLEILNQRLQESTEKIIEEVK